jgi:hypothetical protein
MICVQKWVVIVLIFGMLSSFAHPHSDTELSVDHHQNCLVCLQTTMMVSTFSTNIAPVFHVEADAYMMNKGTILEPSFAGLNQRAPPRLFS